MKPTFQRFAMMMKRSEPFFKPPSNSPAHSPSLSSYIPAMNQSFTFKRHSRTFSLATHPSYFRGQQLSNDHRLTSSSSFNIALSLPRATFHSSYTTIASVLAALPVQLIQEQPQPVEKLLLVNVETQSVEQPSTQQPIESYIEADQEEELVWNILVPTNFSQAAIRILKCLQLSLRINWGLFCGFILGGCTAACFREAILDYAMAYFSYLGVPILGINLAIGLYASLLVLIQLGQALQSLPLIKPVINLALAISQAPRRLMSYAVVHMIKLAYYTLYPPHPQ